MNLESARKLLEGNGSGPWVMDVGSAEVDAENPMAATTYAMQEQTSDLYGYIAVDRILVDGPAAKEKLSAFSGQGRVSAGGPVTYSRR